MQEVRSVKNSHGQSVKNGHWEVLLTDPSLNKFNFGKQLTDKYITTDIISPFGEKSILYNTVSRATNSKVVVELNFEEIDQTRISTISLKASEAFFEIWKVSLFDNRTGNPKKVSQETMFAIEPAIELNKLMKLGFSENQPVQGKTFFELHIEKREQSES